MLTVLVLSGCGGGESAPPAKAGKPESRRAVEQTSTRKVAFAGSPLDQPTFKTIPVKVYTPEPGFYVLIDGEPARTEQGRKLKTPCEVEVLPGNRNVTVVREKHADASQEILVASPRTLEFRPTFQPFAQVVGYFASRFALADTGVPVPLATLNTEGAVWDPFVSADALTIWFAGDRPEGKGIYVARRTSLLHDFDAPELLLRNADAPASPSVTGNELIVAYTVPGKAQVRVLVRDETGQPFKQGPPLAFSERDDEHWLSARLSTDGKILYTAQKRRGEAGAFVVRRKDLDQPFGAKWAPLPLPGIHPLLSHDGLRQYEFDGERLLRSSRRALNAEFSPPEPVAELQLKNFVRRSDYRQCCVSDDEQWLYYTDDPVQSGNLWAVRIANGPGWGYAPRGKAIPQIELARSDEDPEPADKPATEPAKTAASEQESAESLAERTSPLMYVLLQRKLQKLLAEGDLDGAQELVAAARNDARFEKDREVLAWDADDIEQVRAFWNRLREAVGTLKAGDVLRLGPVQVEFTGFKGETIEGKVKGSAKPYSKTLRDLTPADLTLIVDRTLDRNDQTAQLQIAIFLATGGKVSPQLVAARIQKAGEAGRTFTDRRDQRKLHIIDREFARENIAAGLKLIDELVVANPKGATTIQAQALKEKLYAAQNWRQSGGRRWKMTSAGEYSTDGNRSPNSFLMSSRQYENFQLELEWKTTAEVAHGGVWFRFNGKREIRGNAQKIHIANDYDQRAQPDRFSTGSLFEIKGPKENPVRPQGEWNTLRMTVQGDRVQVAINGMPVLDAPLPESSTESKIGRKGYVCLDGEVPGITYRRVLLYELPAGNEK